MRIVYFSDVIPPISDGVTNTLSHLGETLSREDIDFRFYSPIVADSSLPWAHRVRNIASLPLAFHRMYRMGVPYFQDFKRKIDAFDPDLIHVVSPTMLGLFGINYARSRGVPVVSSYHTNFISYFPYYGMRRLEGLGWKYLQWFYNRCSATYAPSPSAANELRRQGIRRVKLWQRGIDTARFSPSFRNDELRRSIGVPDETPILLFVARLVKEKDVDDLIAATRILEQRGRSFKLVVVGDGPERGAMEKQLPHAHFSGHLSGKKLSEMYASSDIFVFPSTTETFGNVILEAFASGLPAVTVDRGGVADLVADGINGFVARGNDPKDFSDKIDRLLADAHVRKRLGHQAAVSSAGYSWNAVNTKLIAGYKRLTGKSKRKNSSKPSAQPVKRSREIPEAVRA
jgi:phosphatidylinositol alpha 1,6-mannosyltransferase